MGFDGQNFEAVDQEGYQNDSLIAGDAQPLDVALHRRIASNARAMEFDFDRCGQHLLLDAADISTATDPDGRAFVSVRGGVFLVVPLNFERPPASVTVDIGADIRGYLLTEADARLTATLKVIGGPEYSATVDVEGATGYDTYRLTIDDLGGASARDALLLLGCQSTNIEEVITTKSNVTSPDDRTATLSGTDYAMTSAATSGQPSPSSGTQQDVYVTSRAQDSVF
ncbi:MAG: hypothetical protein FKY71_08870, partial [Spiribacter salinus]